LEATRPKLSTEGQIFVTLAAAEAWLEANDFSGVEEARRDLTRLLMDAHRVESEPHQVRYRSHADALDLEARVVEEDGLLVVVSINVRELASKGTRAAKHRQEVRRLERRAAERPLTPSEAKALETYRRLVGAQPGPQRPRRIVR